MTGKKLTRFEKISYCEKCEFVKKSGLTTVCGLTNKLADFECNCDKFSNVDSKKPKSNKIENSWILALILSIFGIIRFLLRSGYQDYDVLGILFFMLGIGWLFVAIFHKLLK